MNKNYYKKLLFTMFSLSIFVALHSKIEVSAMAGLLLGESAVLPRPIIDAISIPKTIPSTPAIPHAPVIPPIAKPVLESSRVGGSGKPISQSKRYKTRKEGYEAAKRAGGNHEPDFHPNPKDGRGPHFHPKGSHDHYYVPNRCGSNTYVVKKGDTLSAIASSHGITVQKLLSINGISNPNKIIAGQVIKFEK